ncbi:DUF5074 domain-containing protein [Flavobacterium sp.]|uniref:DUF5074 domain-containing protein n=1 Tax=Flavobacterium sp. TaxID=239 RepID=UPI00286AAAC4|nr:DUF5074 domain-containing protein [Flavobacterium sp.]
MKFSKLFLVALVSTSFFVSCSPDDDTTKPVSYIPLGDYDSGVLVLNQGGFNHNDAAISYISFDLNTLENTIFSLVNPTITLGDVGQDIGLHNDLAYVVLNNTPKIQIVNRYTMANVGSITSGLENPRYIAFANGKGYVTNWGDPTDTDDDFVAVIDLSTNTVTASIPVAEGPERIIENAGKLYVAQNGGYGYGTTITVINPSTNTVETAITVGDVPNGMQIDNGSLWISCGGKPSFAPSETAGKIVKVNLSDNTVAATFSFTDHTQHPSNMTVYGANAYFTIDSGIYKMALNATVLPTTPAFSTTDQGVYGVYSLAIKNNHIYVGDAGNYIDNGKVHIYSLGELSGSSPLGTLEKSHTVGIIPAGFYFNQ